MSTENKLSEKVIVGKVRDFLLKKENGNWLPDEVKESDLHGHGVDLKMKGGNKKSEYFFIECKGKSYAKSARSVNKESWLNALGQIVTRISVKRFTKSRETGKISNINRAYKYGLGLYWVGAQTALRRIPHSAAEVLNLYIFSVDDNGNVKQFTPKDFGKEHPNEVFIVK